MKMNKVIQVLAQMAQQTNVNCEQLLASVEIIAEQAESIINKNVTSLSQQLDIKTDIICAVAPAEDDDENQEQESTEEGGKGCLRVLI
jgi:hypothetical protein